MTTEIKILDSSSINKIETPPLFSSHDRKRYFKVDSIIKELLLSFNGIENKIGYLITY